MIVGLIIKNFGSFHYSLNKIIQQMGESKRLPTLVLGFIIFLVFFGTINTLSDKFQNKQVVVEAGQTKTFYHPYMQTFTMYIGIALSWPTLLVLRKIKPEGFAKRQQEAQEKGKIMKIQKRIFIKYALADVAANIFLSISLNFISASAYQMMRGGSIVTTFLFSIFYLKTKPKRYQIIGTLLTLVGILIVGLSNVLYSSQNITSSSTEEQIIGYILIIVSLFLSGFCFNFEEHMFTKYHIEPLQLLSYQSLSCLFTITVLIAAFTFIPCSFGPTACVLTDNGSYLQRPQSYFSQMGENKPLLAIILFQVFSIFCFNICAINITKHINALARAVCDVIRTVLIWLVGIIITLTVGQSDNTYNWQLTSTGAISLQLVGFLFIIAGNLLYNRIVSLPCLQQLHQQEKLIEKSDNTLASRQ